MNENPVFDREALLRNLGGDEQIAGEVLTLFLEDAPRLLGQAAGAAEKGDAEAVRAAAHQLKGAAAQVGAGVLRARARALEEAAREGRIDEIRTLADSLPAGLEAFRQAAGLE